MDRKTKAQLRFIIDDSFPEGVSGIMFNEKENRIVASFKLQAEKNRQSLILKTVYRNEGKIILAVFDKFLSKYGWKEFEFEGKPGHVVSMWKVNRNFKDVLDKIQDLAKYVNSR